MVNEESSDTLQPGMATPCGPAMRAAIMERAKKLGLMAPSSKEKDTTEGIWVLDFGLQKGMLHTCTIVNSMGLTLIPTHEFLRLMENTKPPKKELTTEERLAEAVQHVKKLVEHGMFPYDDGQLVATNARAFLKSIKP